MHARISRTSTLYKKCFMKREKASRRCDDDVLVDTKDREFVQPFLKYLIIIEYQQYCNPDDTQDRISVRRRTIRTVAQDYIKLCTVEYHLSSESSIFTEGARGYSIVSSNNMVGNPSGVPETSHVRLPRNGFCERNGNVSFALDWSSNGVSTVRNNHPPRLR